MLPLPNLDDRRFQDLVDDAKRLVAHYCPDWTDHNVSDPGVTLIEAFAFMVDELFYRLNRVPDRMYLTFLDLLGVQLHPPSAATTDLTFWLSAPQPDVVLIPAGTSASTRRTEEEDAVVLSTTDELVVPPRRLLHLATQASGDAPVIRRVEQGSANPAFQAHPAPGDALLIGLNDAAPSCAVVVRLDCEVRGVGVDPEHPPLVWEAWQGREWERCELGHDETGGLNRPGDVLLHLPRRHEASVLAQSRAGWLRCRVTEPVPGQPFYSASPVLLAASAFTIGGTVRAVHAETIRDDAIGISEGIPAQSFPLSRAPVVPGSDPFVVEVAGGSGWQEWTEVDTFAGSGPDDRVVQIDRTNGIVHFAPAVRTADGGFQRYGAIPPAGSPIRVPQYRTGGGPRGNVSARAVSVLRSTIPFVVRVENRRAAQGGVAMETVEQARERGPLALRTRDRAVTAEDYEQLARRAAPGIARVRCLPATTEADSGGVRVLIVPVAAVDEDNRLSFADLNPREDILATVADYLDERRPVGARVLVEPPFYRGITVVAELEAHRRVSPVSLRRDALRALYLYFDPLRGGPDGEGWPFGRPVHAGEVHAVLQGLPGTEIVHDVLLFPADPRDGRRGEPTNRIDLDRGSLVFSFEHQVRVKAGA
jgi:predicted phage baseplate assembly protein